MAVSTDFSFSIATQNIPAAKGQHGDLSRAATYAVARAAGAQASLIGFQEVIEAEDDADLKRALPVKTWMHLETSGENNLAIKRTRAKLTPPSRLPRGIESHDAVHLSDGLAHVSPSRNVTYGVLDLLANPYFTPVVFGSFHLVSGVDSRKSHLSYRVDARHDAFSRLQKLVAKWHNAGLNVCLTADTNWGGMPKLHPRQVWLVNAGIDKILWVPAPRSNFDLHLVSVERHANASDHDLRVANVRVKANARYKPPAKPKPGPKPKPAPAPTPAPVPPVSDVTSARRKIATAIELLEKAATSHPDGVEARARVELVAVLASLPME